MFSCKIASRRTALGVFAATVLALLVALAGPATRVAGATALQPVSSYSSTVVADGASAYWQFGGSSSGAFSDSIGTNDGTWSSGSMPQSGNGPLGCSLDTAVAFDGSSAYGDVPSAPALEPAENITIEAWINASQSGHQPVISKGGSGDTADYTLYLDDGVPSLQFQRSRDFDHWTTVTAPAAIGSGWHQVVGTFASNGDGTADVALYVDGSEVASAPAAASDIQATGDDLFIGGGPQGGSLDGSLADVAIYPVALTAAAVGDHYAAGTSPDDDCTGELLSDLRPAPPAVDWDSIEPGEQRLIAVLPAGSDTWLSPDALPGLTSDPLSRIASVPSAGDGASAAASAGHVFGCETNVNAPGWSGSALQGSVSWYACVWIAEIVDNVGIQRQGAIASFYKQNVHFGNANWTAWSAKNYNCSFVNRKWRTLDNSEVESISGDVAWYAGVSPYAPRNC